MTHSPDIDHTADNDGGTGYYAVNAGLVIQVFDMFQMRPSHFRASGQTGAHGVYYDARKIIEGRTDNRWGHHTPSALKSFCHFTQSENGTLVPWRELIEHREAYDGKEGAGPRTGNRLGTEHRLRLNHTAMTETRRQCGLTREQLAEKTALPTRFIEALEGGSWGTVTKSTAGAIAAALGVAEETLFMPLSDKKQPDAAGTPANTAATTPRKPASARPMRTALLLAPVAGLLLWAGYQFYTGNRYPSVEPDWISLPNTGGAPPVALTRHEITNQDYLQFVRQQPDFNRDRMMPGMHDGDYLKHWLSSDQYPPDSADHPVTYVSWYAARAYCQWIGGRLPRLEEWHLATQGLQTTLTSVQTSGLNLCDRRCAVHDDISPNRSPKAMDYDDGYAETAPVASGFASAAGLTHLYGNVAEWLDETSGETGAIIGGSFLATLPEAVSTTPVPAPKRLASRDVGFRCARSQP